MWAINEGWPACWWCQETCYDDWHLRSRRQENLSSVCLSHWGRIKDAQKSDSEWKLWAAHFTGTNKLSFYSFIMCQHFVVCWVSFRELKTSDWNTEIIHERKILKRDYFQKREPQSKSHQWKSEYFKLLQTEAGSVFSWFWLHPPSVHYKAPR